jgi:hypothetical protein
MNEMFQWHTWFVLSGDVLEGLYTLPEVMDVVWIVKPANYPIGKMTTKTKLMSVKRHALLIDWSLC